MPWTLIHVINEASPLHGFYAETLARADARLFLTVEARDHVLAASVLDMKDYSVQHIRFGMRFADAVMVDGDGHTTADLSRLSLLVPDADVHTNVPAAM